MIWYFLNDIILRSFYNYCIFNATNVYLTLRRSIKLLTIEYQKGHTSYEERAHFLVSKNWGGGTITDLNYWIKHPFEFSDPILKPEYL